MEELKQKITELYNSDSLDEKRSLKSEIFIIAKDYKMPLLFKQLIGIHLETFKQTGIKTELHTMMALARTI
jgi:hypothetical protein